MKTPFWISDFGVSSQRYGQFEMQNSKSKRRMVLGDVRFVFCILHFAFCISALPAVEAVPLGDPASPTWGFRFDNGQEFPGATGKLGVDPAVTRDGKPGLKLEGDFTKGGTYVQALIDTPAIDIDELSFWFKGPGSETQCLRIVDSGGQCHQFNLKVQKTTEWQLLSFPLAQFFARRNVHEAVAKYEAWGSKDQGRWKGPAKLLALLLGPSADKKTTAIWISDPKIYPKPDTLTGTQVIRLDDFVDGEIDWTLFLGNEFPGAQGTLTAEKDQPRAGLTALKLAGDFTKGGAYIDAGKELPKDVQETQAIRLKVMSSNATGFSVRLIDTSGQCHQKKGYRLAADGQWKEFAILPSEVAGGEHWGGANDGKWHGPATSVHILIGSNEDPVAKKPVLLMSDIRLEALVATAVQAASFRQDFEAADALKGWSNNGAVALDDKAAFKGTHSLRLSRGEQHIDDATVATSPSFNVAPGEWVISGACATELRSPDFSYNGQVLIEWLDRAGGVVGQAEAALAYGKQAWQPFRKQLGAPANAASARFRILLNKTNGTFNVDELSAAFVAPATRKTDRIDRITYASARLGNMLYPEDKPAFTATVEAFKPLPEDQRKLTFQLRDYWGAELTEARTAALGKAERRGRGRVAYKAEIDLAGAALETGKYYELHVRIEQPGAEPFLDQTSFVILPEAEANKHKPEEIPFTSRNWDNRLGEYFQFSHRIGIRVCGLWGDSQYELCEKLGMNSLSGPEINSIETHRAGYEKLTEPVLRASIRALIGKCGKHGLRMISLGNEPPPTEERARECVPAYRAVYEELKKIDPTIQVIGTSVGPCEAYFKAGFGPYQDVYDFHVYEEPQSIRNAFAEYKRLFAKYGNEKPIVATEIGLNSQGLTRLAISSDLIRKLAVFFACGGLHISWFDIMYPDTDGKSLGSNGDSMNVFNCRYNNYSPRLDAIAYYNMVNGICVKKCLGEKTYDGGIQATLFKDAKDACFLVLYKDKGRQDAFVPLPGTGVVKVLHIDGSLSTLDAGQKGVTLGIAEEPLLLLYQSSVTSLPERLGVPAAALAALPESVVKGGAVDLTFALGDLAPDALTVAVPPSWTARKGATGAAGGKPTVTWTVTAPENTAAREGRILVSLGKSGELYFGIPVTGRMSVRLLPTAMDAPLTPPSPPGVEGRVRGGVQVLVRNHGREQQKVSAQLSLLGEFAMAKGSFAVTQPAATKAFFADVAEASLDIAGGAEKLFSVPLSGVDPQTIYRVRATVTDQTGRSVSRERLVAGFVAVHRCSAGFQPALETPLDQGDWKRSPVLRINEERQFFGFNDKRTWRGPNDLSAEIRFLWDDQNLYVAVKVSDDVFRNEKQDGDIWAGDGLQFLVDPCRESPDKAGKYDYCVAVGKKGPQAWCNSSADSSAPIGNVPTIRFAAKPAGDGTGGMSYVVAIPWPRMAPFKPGLGRNLGLAMILNDDDGTGRDCFMGWFSGVHSKEIDLVGDLILEE